MNWSFPANGTIKCCHNVRKCIALARFHTVFRCYVLYSDQKMFVYCKWFFVWMCATCVRPPAVLACSVFFKCCAAVQRGLPVFFVFFSCCREIRRLVLGMLRRPLSVLLFTVWRSSRPHVGSLWLWRFSLWVELVLTAHCSACVCVTQRWQNSLRRSFWNLLLVSNDV